MPHSTRTLALAGLILAACGGGGSGGPPPATFSISTYGIDFVATSPGGATPTAQVVRATVSGSLSGTLYIVITAPDPAVATVGSLMVTSPTSGQVTVTPASPASLGIGVFRSSITVRACLNDPTCATGQLSGSPQVIGVTYTIPGLMVSAPSLSYPIGNVPAVADRSRTLTVTGAPTQAWTATSNVPWLSVAPAGGLTTSPVDLTAALVQPELDAMTNGTYRGAVTITPAMGLPIGVPVTLVVARTQVNDVAPYLAFAGTSAEVIIRGEHLSQITVQDVKFGGASASSFTVVSDTEVRATYPLLPAGTHPVRLQNPQGFDTSLARLVVVDRPSYTATTLSYPLAPNPLEPFGFAYDAERGALLISRAGQGGDTGVLLRYPFTGGAWSTPTQVAVPGISSLGLSADGAEWFAGTKAVSTGGGTINAGIARIRATDLLVGATVQTGISPGSGTYLDTPLAANDGSVIALLSGASIPVRFTARDWTYSSLAVGGAFGGAAGSADGSRIVMGSAAGNQVHLYDAGSGVASSVAVDFLPVIRTAPALDRTGARFILNDGHFNTGLVRVFDGATFAALGDLPGSTVAAVLSPDGMRAYTFDSSGKLRTFDLSGTPPGAGKVYPEVGTGTTLAGSPGTPALVVGLGIRMIISPDGGTVFLAGGDRVVVQPVP